MAVYYSMKHRSLLYHILLGVLVIVTIIVYYPGLWGSFLNWDDDSYIINNVLIREFSISSLTAMFSGYFHGHYHPLTLVSLMIDFQIDGMNPFVFHLTNLILHLLNILLVFVFIKLLSKNYLVAFFSAAFFALHPMNAESVVWVTERKNLLFSFFFLLSLIQYLRYSSTNKSRNYYFSFLLFIIAVLSKGIAIVLPLVLIAVDYVNHRKLISRKVIFEKIPFLIVALIFGLVAINANLGNTIKLGYQASVLERIVYTNYAFALYIFKLLIPLKLSAMYPYLHVFFGHLPAIYYLFLPVILLFFIVLIYLIRKGQRLMVFGLSLFAINVFLLLKTFDVPSGDYIIADRYVYLAGIGIFLSLLVLVDQQIQKHQRLKIPLLSFLVLVLIGFGFLTHQRAIVWSDSFRLWDDVLSKYPYATSALNNRGGLKAEMGDLDGAMDDCSKAIFYDSTSYIAHLNRGIVYGAREEYEDALASFDKALKIHPFNPESYMQRGYIKFKMLDYKSAINDYSVAIKYNPGNPEYYFYRGNAFADFGDLPTAIEDYSKTIELNPYHAKAWFIRGMAYIETGEKARGCENLKKSLDLGYEWAATKIRKNCEE